MRRTATLLLACALALAGCSGEGSVASAGNAAPAQAGAEVALVSAAELRSLMEQGKVVLVDVRTPAEFGEARLHGALNAPLQTFDPAAIPMEAERETILYCRSSGRSGRAATMLAEHLGTRVRHMEGGILAWQEAGFDTVQ